MPDLLSDGAKMLTLSVLAFNETIVKDKIPQAVVNENELDVTPTSSLKAPIDLLQKTSNEVVNEIFLAAQEESHATSYLADLFL